MPSSGYRFATDDDDSLFWMSSEPTSSVGCSSAPRVPADVDPGSSTLGSVGVHQIHSQDGTQKAPTQDYHGSSRPHVHVSFFASLAAMNLPELVPATLPEASDEADILPGLAHK